MTTLLPSAARRSRWLFDFSARDALAAPDQSLNANTGQVGTFSRASVKTAIDANGLLYTAGHSLPAFHWALDAVSGMYIPGVSMSDGATNVVLQNRDLANASWSKTNITAVKDQTGITGVPNSASSILATAANAVIAQATVMGSSVRMQSAYVKRITGSGVVQMTTDNAVSWITIPVTSAWTRVTIPLQTLANPTFGFKLVTSGDKIAVDFVQNELAVLTAPIETTTVTVTRAADSLVFPVNLPPIALTVYADIVQLGGVPGATTQIVAALGSAINTTPQLYLGLINGTVNTVLDTPTTDSSASLAVIIATGNGQRVEMLSSITAPTTGGVVTTSASIDGGAITSATSGVTATAFSAWNGQWLIIGNLGAGVIPGTFSLQRLRIGAGAQTMPVLRAG